VSILTNFEVVDGRELRPVIKPAVIAIDVESEPYAGFTTQSRHVIRAQLGAEFWANKAQYETALKIARRALVQRIHGPVLNLIHELRFAVYNIDTEHAMELIDRMEVEMLGEFK
jgi:hypothetical protein